MAFGITGSALAILDDLGELEGEECGDVVRIDESASEFRDDEGHGFSLIGSAKRLGATRRAILVQYRARTRMRPRTASTATMLATMAVMRVLSKDIVLLLMPRLPRANCDNDGDDDKSSLRRTRVSEKFRNPQQRTRAGSRKTENRPTPEKTLRSNNADFASPARLIASRPGRAAPPPNSHPENSVNGRLGDQSAIVSVAIVWALKTSRLRAAPSGKEWAGRESSKARGANTIRSRTSMTKPCCCQKGLRPTLPSAAVGRGWLRCSTLIPSGMALSVAALFTASAAANQPFALVHYSRGL
ncbi:hypothetical protein F4678DRAFT_462735 [Xylaria arbuscula]|nr:hypothetical protein F4678DRAFT_462735 [Xylaria arbuscula]